MLDAPKSYRVIAHALREEGFEAITDRDVERTHRDLEAGRRPAGIIDRAIARHLHSLNLLPAESGQGVG